MHMTAPKTFSAHAKHAWESVPKLELAPNAPHVIATASQVEDGFRYWGVCRTCGHIDEIGCRLVEVWAQQALCLACENHAVVERFNG